MLMQRTRRRSKAADVWKLNATRTDGEIIFRREEAKDSKLALLMRTLRFKRYANFLLVSFIYAESR